MNFYWLLRDDFVSVFTHFVELVNSIKSALNGRFGDFKSEASTLGTEVNGKLGLIERSSFQLIGDAHLIYVVNLI